MIKFQDFAEWVRKKGQSPIESIRCFARIEPIYGCIIKNYDDNKCEELLREFSYSKSDLLNGKPRHKIKFNTKLGDILSDESFINQTRQFKYHVKRYVNFRKST